MMVGLLVMLIFFAASVDAILWQQSAQRDAMRSEAALMQAHINRLQIELSETQTDNQILRELVGEDRADEAITAARKRRAERLRRTRPCPR
jgi:hypothetical protein